MKDENVELMKKNGKIVLLTASPETIYDRVLWNKFKKFQIFWVSKTHKSLIKALNSNYINKCTLARKKVLLNLKKNEVRIKLM